MSNLMHVDGTRRLIASTPLSRQARQIPDEIAKWLKSIVPSLTPEASQSAEVTELVVTHLKHNGVSDANIVAALYQCHNKWTFPGSGDFFSISTLARMREVERERKEKEETRLGTRAPSNLAALRLRAANLDAQYTANPHLPELQKKLMENLIVLLSEGGIGDGIDAANDMKNDYERQQENRRQILINARTMEKELVYYIGPLGLARLKSGAPPPDGGYRISFRPNVVRTAPRRVR